MFAITFDMDTTMLRVNDDTDSDIARTLGRFGFSRQQDSVYFGDDSVDAVRCVLAVQQLARDHVWFKAPVRDIRMLRIEDNNDLMPAALTI